MAFGIILLMARTPLLCKSWERRGGCGQGGFAIFFLMGTGARGGSFKRNCFGVGTNHPVRAFQRNGDIS